MVASWHLPALSLTVALVMAQPAPFVVQPSGQFDGDDGSWSSFEFELGTPFQQVRLLPATSGSSFAPIVQQACASNSNYTSCANQRGGLYNSNTSATWTELGIYAYALDTNLAGAFGDDATAYYGQDTVRLAWPGEASPTINSTLISGLSADNLNLYDIGQFGLTPHATNLSSLGNSYPTVLEWMRSNNQIPSLSWGYTAGCANTVPPAFGSLTLGGYDQSKFVAHNSTFPFSRNGGDVVVGLQSITIDQAGANTNALVNPIYANIDSQIPTIVLPVEACQAFEKLFNLTYTVVDNSTMTGYYFINDTQHTALLDQSPTFAFSLGSSLAGGSTVQINLPYTAFDLQLTPPLGRTGGTRYFPLQRAANSSQYVLGRTFLQYAYLTVDFDRQNFTVSQALFPQDQPAQLQAIYAPGTGPSSSSSSSGHLSGGAIAGIVIGVVAALAIIAGAAAFFIIRRRRARAAADQVAWQTPGPMSSEFSGQTPGTFSQGYSSPGATSEQPYWGAATYNKVELSGEARTAPTELPGDKSDIPGLDVLTTAQRQELEGHTDGDMRAKVAPDMHELDATSVPAEMAERQ